MKAKIWDLLHSPEGGKVLPGALSHGAKLSRDDADDCKLG